MINQKTKKKKLEMIINQMMMKEKKILQYFNEEPILDRGLSSCLKLAITKG